MRPASEEDAGHDTVAKPVPFYEILELDNPDHLDCHRCKKLHHIDDALIYSAPWTKCGKDDQNLRMGKYIHPDFNSTVFRMIMKKSRQGKDVSGVMRLLSYRGKVVVNKSQVSQLISEPRIVGGRLLMRSQTTYVVSPNKAVRTLLLNRNLVKCPHNNRMGFRNVKTTKLLFDKFEKHEDIGHQERIYICSCSKCPTEFEVFLQYFEGQGVLLFIVKWQDIGTGLEPLDNDLRPIIGPRPSPYSLTISSAKPIEYESPKGRFEGVTSDEDLLTAPATLSISARDEVFRVYASCGAHLLRLKDRFFWPIGKVTRMFPHNHRLYGPDAHLCRCGQVCSCGLRWE